MRRLSRGSALLTLALASCVAPRERAPEASPPPAPAQAPPSPPAPATPMVPGTVSLDGPLEQGALVRGTVSRMPCALTVDGQAVPIAPDGAFLLGFARDARPQSELVATFADGSVQRQMLTIAPRQWDVQSLPTLRKMTPRTPDEIARRQAEVAAIVAARAVGTDSEGWREALRWPVTGRISTHFGSERVYAGEPGDPHSGTDIARPQGTPVAAPADGVVVLAAAQPFSLEGNLLMIDHGMGLSSAFLHLSRIDVKVGDKVRQGQILGAVGMTGRATGPHLHWGLVLRGIRLDPELVAGPMPAG